MRTQIYTPELKEKKKVYYQTNRHRIIARTRERYKKNSEILKAKQRQYNLDHPLTDIQKVSAKIRSALHYKRNRDAVLKRTKRYHKDNPEVARRASVICNHKRRAQKQKSLVDPKVINTWIKEIRLLPFVRCYWCGTKVKGRSIHFDHIIPLSKNGEHTISNLCASCADCNLSKHDKLLTDWICRGQTFLSL